MATGYWLLWLFYHSLEINYMTHKFCLHISVATWCDHSS